MPKTALDTTTEALRLIGVTAVDESADADDHARARQHLEAVFAELSETHGLALNWTVETVPDRLWPFMAAAVAGSICDCVVFHTVAVSLPTKLILRLCRGSLS